ncbi:MAG: hypothetical protein ACE5Z5_01085 [Candidatus Bathyarchaeia archaeon]
MFSREGPPPYERRRDEVSIGDVLTVRTFRGKDGGVIGRLRDGRVILFNKESVFFDQLDSGQVVEARVNYVARTYVIVDPLSPPKIGVDALKVDLKALAESEHWEHAVLAEALLYVIRMMEGLAGEETTDEY